MRRWVEKKKRKTEEKKEKDDKKKKLAREKKQANPCCVGKLKSAWVGCDDEDCPNGGWMHLSCAGLKAVPKGEWFCAACV